MIGAGGMAPHLIEAHCALRPTINEVFIWNRTAQRCHSAIEKLAEKNIAVTQTHDLEAAMQQADLISSAVTTPSPYIKGELLKPGTHVDLIGAFTEDLREADNETIRRR